MERDGETSESTCLRLKNWKVNEPIITKVFREIVLIFATILSKTRGVVGEPTITNQKRNCIDICQNVSESMLLVNQLQLPPKEKLSSVGIFQNIIYNTESC